MPPRVPLPSTAHLPPQQTQASQQSQAQSQQQQQQAAQNGQAAAQQAAAAAQQDALSVILVTGGYDNTIRFWEAWSGVCSRTVNHPDHVSVRGERRGGVGGAGWWLIEGRRLVHREADDDSFFDSFPVVSLHPRFHCRSSPRAGTPSASPSTTFAPPSTACPPVPFTRYPSGSAHLQQVNRLAISPDKRYLAAAGNGTIKLYDIAASAAGTSGANVGPASRLCPPGQLGQPGSRG